MPQSLMSAFYQPQIEYQQLQNLASERQLRNIQVEKAQQDLETQKSMQSLMQQAFGGQQQGKGLMGMAAGPQTVPTNPQESIAQMHEQLGRMMYSSGLLKQGQSEFEEARKVRKDMSEDDKRKVETEAKRSQLIGSIAGTVHDQASLDAALSMAREKLGEDSVRGLPTQWNSNTKKVFDQISQAGMTRSQALNAQHQAAMEGIAAGNLAERIREDRVRDADRRSKTAIERERLDIKKKAGITKSPYDKYYAEHNRIYQKYQSDWQKIKNSDMDDKAKAKALQTLDTAYDRNEQALVDRFASQGVVSSSRKLGGAEAASKAMPMPTSKDQLKKNQKYDTPRGTAIWDGSKFVSVDDEEED